MFPAERERPFVNALCKLNSWKRQIRRTLQTRCGLHHVVRDVGRAGGVAPCLQRLARRRRG